MYIMNTAVPQYFTSKIVCFKQLKGIESKGGDILGPQYNVELVRREEKTIDLLWLIFFTSAWCASFSALILLETNLELE